MGCNEIQRKIDFHCQLVPIVHVKAQYIIKQKYLLNRETNLGKKVTFM